MIFKVKKGLDGKLIRLQLNKDAELQPWITRRDLAFTECLINPSTVVRGSKGKSLAERLALEGYALFGGDTGGDKTAEYVLAVPFHMVEIK